MGGCIQNNNFPSFIGVMMVVIYLLFRVSLIVVGAAANGYMS